MHKTFNFPLTCSGSLKRWDRIVVLKEDKGETTIRGGSIDTDNILDKYYDPFEQNDLIPSFIGLTEKVLHGEDLEKHIIKWHVKWGPLYSNYKKQTVKVFWEECLRFYKLWNFYKAIANRVETEVYKYINIKHESDDSYELTFFPMDESFKPEEWPLKRINNLTEKKLFPEIDDEFTFPAILDNISNRFEQIQWYSIMFFLEQVENYTSHANLINSGIKREDVEGKTDFKVQHGLNVDNLIDAIYLQLYILFTENEKKICVTCNSPFVPERKDKKYCSESCKLTAKSRRYRARKNK